MTEAEKRTHDDASVSVASSRKKARLFDVSTREDIPDPRTVLPAPSTAHVRLRFQLARFKGVFRTVALPLNYSFAHLHLLVQYLFGWGGGHVHQAKVYAAVELYSRTNRPGEIKKYGRAPPMPDDWLEGVNADHERVAFERRMWEQSRKTEAEWVVRERGKKDGWDSLGMKPGKRGDDVLRKDAAVRLDEVWNEELEKNASEGDYGNDEIAINYEYDLSSPWNVHITLDGDKPFVTVDDPSNLPNTITVKGAAPIEDDDSVYPEPEDNKKKPVDEMIFDPQAFAQFLNGEVSSYVGRKKQSVYNFAEARAQKLAAASQASDLSTP